MKRYRGRAVQGQIQVEVIQSTGTQYVSAIVESTLGEMQGQRMRWRGYLNSDSNIEDTVAQLRAMGWRGVRLGDWQGLGSKDVDFTATADDGLNLEGKATKFWTAAFVRTPATLNEEKALGTDQVDELNAKLARLGLLGAKNGAAPRGPVPTAADDYDEFPPPALTGGR